MEGFGVGGGIREFLSTVCTCKTEEVYIHGKGMSWLVFYLHGRNLQVRYLQYDQVWYICQRDQFQRMAFQGIETP